MSQEILLGEIYADPEKLNWLSAKLGLDDKQDLINFALNILEWCVEKKQDGCSIVAVKDNKVHILANEQLDQISHL